MQELIIQILGGLVRYVLAGVFGWLIANGIIQPGQVDTLVSGIVGALIVIGWFLYQKIKAHKIALAALTLPAGSTLADAKAVYDVGAAPSAKTPATEAPTQQPPVTPVKPAGGQ